MPPSKNQCQHPLLYVKIPPALAIKNPFGNFMALFKAFGKVQIEWDSLRTAYEDGLVIGYIASTLAWEGRKFTEYTSYIKGLNNDTLVYKQLVKFVAKKLNVEHTKIHDSIVRFHEHLHQEDIPSISTELAPLIDEKDKRLAVCWYSSYLFTSMHTRCTYTIMYDALVYCGLRPEKEIVENTKETYIHRLLKRCSPVGVKKNTRSQINS